MEAQNHDWEARYEAWYLRGKVGPRPRCDAPMLHCQRRQAGNGMLSVQSEHRYRFFGFLPWSLEWWGGMCCAPWPHCLECNAAVVLLVWEHGVHTASQQLLASAKLA